MILYRIMGQSYDHTWFNTFECFIDKCQRSSKFIYYTFCGFFSALFWLLVVMFELAPPKNSMKSLLVLLFETLFSPLKANASKSLNEEELEAGFLLDESVNPHDVKSTTFFSSFFYDFFFSFLMGCIELFIYWGARLAFSGRFFFGWMKDFTFSSSSFFCLSFFCRDNNYSKGMSPSCSTTFLFNLASYYYFLRCSAFNFFASEFRGIL